MNSEKKITWMCYEFNEISRKGFILDELGRMEFKDGTLYFKLKDLGGLVPLESAIFLEKNEKLYKMTDEGIKEFAINYMGANESLSSNLGVRVI